MNLLTPESMHVRNLHKKFVYLGQLLEMLCSPCPNREVRPKVLGVGSGGRRFISFWSEPHSTSQRNLTCLEFVELRQVKDLCLVNCF